MQPRKPEYVTVCVIGAGPAGLATAKALVDNQVDNFVVLEASSSVGGLWRPPADGGHTWRCSSGGGRPASMRTNLSKYKCEFSDTPHKESTPLFPSADDMLAYLRHYAETNGINANVRLHHKVTSVQPCDPQSDGGGEGTVGKALWEVRATLTGDPREVTFQCRYAVVCTGVFTEPVVPVGLSALVQPSSPNCGEECRSPPVVRHSQGFDTHALSSLGSDPRVLVIGNAFSGADLASAITAAVTTPVVVVCRRPRWCLPRWMNAEGASVAAPTDEQTRAHCTPDAIPWDLIVERRHPMHDSNHAYLSDVCHSQLHYWGSSCTGRQPSEMPVPINVKRDSSLMVICDAFTDDVRRGAIRIIRSIPPPDVLRRAYNLIVCATGYSCRLPFLPYKILQEISFDSQDTFLPVVLYKSTLHPTRDNLFFVGLYRGPYMFALEVQARWVAALISGHAKPPPQAKRLHWLAIERRLRSTRGAMASDKGQPHGFPHSNVVEFADSLAEEYGAKPLVSAYPFLEGCPVVASQYRCDKKEFQEKLKLFKARLDCSTRPPLSFPTDWML